MIVGLIADGNRRWAKSKNLSSKEGHQKGFNVVTDIVIPACYNRSNCTGLVVYGFSTENWKRSPIEVANLMQIYTDMCDRWETLFLQNPTRLKWCGRRDRLPKALVKKLENIESETAHIDRFTVYICLDYGSQDEIQRAVKCGGSNFEKHLEVPPIDLIIRSGGEQRLSNFCLYQAAYSEFYFEPRFLPEFTDEIMKNILDDFKNRNRRKGGNASK